MKKKLFFFNIFLCIGVSLPSFASTNNKTLILTAEKVQQIVLDSNYSVTQAKIRQKIADQNIVGAKSIYDTTLAANASHNIDDSAKSSTLFGSRTDTTSWDVSLNKKIFTGTQAGIEFQTGRTKYHDPLSINGNPIFPSAAIYEPIIAFTITQPLLNNSFGYIDRKSVKTSKLYSLATKLSTQREIENLVYNTLETYWNFILIKKHIRALEKSVEFARNFRNTTKEEFKLGTAEETDLLAAKANVLVREDELLRAKQIKAAWQEILLVTLGLTPDTKIQTKEDEPALLDINNQNEQRIENALLKRTDFQASKKELEIRNVGLKMAKNSRWPSLDLYSSLELNEIDTSYTNAIKSTDSPNFTVGLQLSVPIENRKARSEKKKADLQKTAAIVALKDLENRIINSVDRNLNEVKARKTIVLKSTMALNLQEKKLKQERKKYSLGRSSSDLIIRYQDDVINAKRTNIEAWLAYQKSVLNLKLAEGNLIR